MFIFSCISIWLSKFLYIFICRHAFCLIFDNRLIAQEVTMSEFKRILVVVALIQSGRIAIRNGVSLARKYRAELFVLHSIYNPFGPKEWGLGTWALAEEYEQSRPG